MTGPGRQPVSTSPPGFGAALAQRGSERTRRQGARTGQQQCQEQRHCYRSDYKYRPSHAHASPKLAANRPHLGILVLGLLVAHCQKPHPARLMACPLSRLKEGPKARVLTSCLACEEILTFLEGD